MAENTLLKYVLQKKQKEEERRWRLAHDKEMANYRQDLSLETEGIKSGQKTRQLNKMVSQFKRSEPAPFSQSSDAELRKWLPPGVEPTYPSGYEHPEDYILEPTIKNVRGVPIRTNQKKLKPSVQEATIETLKAGRRTSEGLVKNVDRLTPEIRKKMGPVLLGHVTAMNNDLGNMLLNLESSLFNDPSTAQFAEFKSQSDVLFQSWRKFITGVQAAYPEIKMLKPDYPHPTDTPEVYISKARGLVEQARDTEQLMLDMESQRGFRTGELRTGSIKYNPLVSAALGKGGSLYDNSEETMVAQALASVPQNRNSILRKYKERTGRDYSG